MDSNGVALTLISWNIAFADPSFVAPNRASRSREAPRLIREECRRSNPDIICLQECPSSTWGSETFGPDYVSLGTQLASHVRGHIDLLVRRDLAPNARRIALEHPAFPLPAVAVSLTLSNGTNIAICSIHFPNGKEGANARELMCESIMQIISQECSNCIVVGDSNMRDSEEKKIENLAGGRWIDVWKHATGENQEFRFTWNSFDNKFHENGFRFRCRFDRCFMRGNELSARRFNLIGNQPVNGAKGDYLSDHFGIAVEIGVGSSSSVPSVVRNMMAQKRSRQNSANGSNSDMVDLTGDSDEEEGGMDQFESNDSGNSRNSDSNNAGANRNDRKISAEEMRRLRLQKFSGVPTESAYLKPTVTRKASISPCSLTALKSGPDNSDGKSKDNQSTQPAVSSGDIEPVKPKKCTIAQSRTSKRYIIYMAIRERKDSRFSKGLAKCNEACHEGMQHCLQMQGTRHITLFDGNLTSDRVESLAFNGSFDPVDIEFSGYQTWDAGCYLKLSDESKKSLKDLLARIDGLPPFGGKRPCDHLSLYRKRPQTKHPNPKREFRKIREATRSHNWGSVEGVSIRVKALGGSYDECMVLADAQSPSGVQCSQSKSSNFQKAQACYKDSESELTQSNSSNENIINLKHPAQNDQLNDGWDSNADKTTRKTGSGDSQNAATFRDHSFSENSSILLSTLSWNLSEASMGDVSAAAPDPTLRAQQSARLVREECLRPHFASQKQNGKAYLPDIIALQETPDGWGTDVFGPSGYVSIGTRASHCGFVDLLIREDFSSQRIRLVSMNQMDIPSVAAIITLPNKTKIAVASNHLAPFADGATSRAHECNLLTAQLTKHCSNCMLIGDFNMRQKEDRMMENGLGWSDAWKEGSGSSKILKMTWNSFDNLYHNNGFGFTCRFDRCYVRGNEVSMKQFGLVGNRPVNGVVGDYLSDHYGIAVEVNVARSPEINDEKAKVAAKIIKESARLDCKNTARGRGLKNGDVARSSDDRNTQLKASQRPQSGKGNAANVDASAPMQMIGHDRRKNNEQCNAWSSEDETMGSEVSSRRMNQKQGISMAAAKSTKSTSNSFNSTIQPANNGSDLSQASQEEQKKRIAKKRCRCDSSSSEEDVEEMLRHWRKNRGKKPGNLCTSPA